MILETEDAGRFYRVWWPLLTYVNEELQVFDELTVRSQDGALAFEQTVELRDALWADDDLREDFLRKNPAGLSDRDLDLVSSWRTRISGSFFVERHLKRYSVFIGTEQSQVFGVKGLLTPIELLLAQRPPNLVEAVLLPYDDQIIIDGLMGRSSVQMSFGPGIRRMLKETYDTARKSGKIITSFSEVSSGDG